MIITKENVAEILEKISQEKRLFIDTETTGLNAFMGDVLCGVGVGTSESIYYFPFRHKIPEDHSVYGDWGENLPIEWLPKLIEAMNNARSYVGHNIKFDLKFLEKEGLSTLGKTLVDTLVMLRLTSRSHFPKMALTDVVDADYGKENGDYDREAKAIMRKHGWLADYSTAPVNLLGTYCIKDVYWCRQIYYDRMAVITRTAQSDVWHNSVYLTGVLHRMEMRGIPVDTDYVQDSIHRINDRVSVLEEQIYKVAGEEFNISSNVSLGRIFKQLGVKSPEQTAKGNDSWNEAALVQIDHPLSGMVREYRTLTKYLNTYFEPFSKVSELHCSFNNWGTVTGRLSSSHPNMQNIPRGVLNTIIPELTPEMVEELKKRLRAIVRAKKKNVDLSNHDMSTWAFLGEEDYDGSDPSKVSVRRSLVPREGYKLYGFDYKQMEVWVFLSYFMTPEELDALKESGTDLHSASAVRAFGVTEDHPDFAFYRQMAKNITFGIIYGMGDDSTAKSIGVTTKEAAEYKKTYFDNLPGAETFIDKVRAKVRQTGVLHNRYGRKYWIEPEKAYVGVNYLVQGTSADIIADRMVELDKFLADKKSNMLLQVHDELIIEIHESEEHLIPQIQEIMSVNKIGLPLQVDVELHHPSWAHKPKEGPEVISLGFTEDDWKAIAKLASPYTDLNHVYSTIKKELGL